jgi:hypothetical protein
MKVTSIARLWVVVLLAFSIPVYAQREPHPFFKNVIKLTDAEIQTIDQGQIVTKVLDSADNKYGLLVFGTVYVNAPIKKFADVYRDVNKLEKEKVYLAVQEFGQNGSPVKLSDFDRLELEKSDIDKLEDCKPGDCDLQLMNEQELKKQIDWKSNDKYGQVNKAVRQRAYDRANVYMNGGLKALGSYTDLKKPLNLYDAMKEMVDASYYLPKGKVPDIYGQIVDYPEGKMADAVNVFYWENINFGQGPVFRINHVSLFPNGHGPAKLIVANKQLYASKYMRTALQMFYCVPDTQNTNKPGFYLIEMSDSRLPDFGSLKLMVVRKIATSTAVEGTHDTLEIFRRRSTAN